MSVRRGVPLTLPFFAVDSADPPNGKGSISWAAGDVKVSKDGGNFANASNTPASIGSGPTGAYKIDLTSAEMDAVALMVSIEKSGMDPLRLTILTSADPSGTVVTDAGNNSSTFKTDRTEATNDFWKDALLVFVSGSLIHQVKRISAYNGTTKFASVSSAFTGTPANGDRFVLVNK